MTQEAPPTETIAEETDPKQPVSLRISVLVLIVGIAFAAIVQYLGQDTDYQNANFIALGAIVVSSLYFLTQLQRRMAAQGNRLRVPLALLALVLVFPLCFRFEGFSGEMKPLFRLRWGARADLPLREIDARSAPADLMPFADPAAVSERGSDLRESPQFLGPSRNGIYQHRQFAVPQSQGQCNVLWRQGIGEGWSSFAVQAGLAYTTEQRGDDECLTCYRVSDGELIWVAKHEGLHSSPPGGVGPRSTPAVEGGLVYASTATGFLWCVDTNTGNPVWTADLCSLAQWKQSDLQSVAPWGYACSPLLVDNLCVMTLGGLEESGGPHSLIALDARTGETVWKSGSDQISYASPVLLSLDGVQQIVSVNEDSVSGHAVSDGKLLWEFDWPGKTNSDASCSSAMKVGQNQVFLGKGYGGGSMLVKVVRDGESWAAQETWSSSRLLKTKFNHTCVIGNLGFGINNGALQAVDLEAQQQLWLQPRRNRAGQGQAVLVEDTILVQDETGDVVFVSMSTDEYEELFRMTALDSKTWNIPTVSGRRLLLRNDREAVCIELPERKDRPLVD